MIISMKKFAAFAGATLLAALVAGCSTCASCPCENAPKISVFSSTIENIAKYHGVSYAQAADMLRAAGVDGFDCAYNSSKLADYAATSLKPANLYGFMKFYTEDGGRKQCDEFVATAVKYGVSRIMCVPSNFTDGRENEAEFLKNLEGVKYLVAQGRKYGVAVTIEDYGGDDNPCSWIKYLKRFMNEIPELRYALDSGNLVHAGRGEDILEMMRFSDGRIEHVHLKDFKHGGNRARETVGLGNVPNAEIVRTMNAKGYDGWYTLEDLVGENRYEDVVRQAAVVRYWCSGK